MIGERDKIQNLYEAKRARAGQEEQETDRASMNAHSKAAGPLSGNSPQNSHRCICLSYLEERHWVCLNEGQHWYLLFLNIRASFYLEYSRFFLPQPWTFLLITQVWSLNSRHIQRCDPHSGFLNSFGGRLVEDGSPWVACDLFWSQCFHLLKWYCLEQWFSTCATRPLCGVK